MITAQTHYRAFFDIEAARKISLDCISLAKLVRKWIKEKEGFPAELSGAWYYTGGDWKRKEDSRVHVHTTSDGEVASPTSVWSVRYEHPDSEHKCRLWISDITFQKATETRFRFAMHVYYRIAPGYLGEEPALPTPTTPRLITKMLESKEYSVVAGTSRLTSGYSIVEVGSAKSLSEGILNAGRLIPYVVISVDANNYPVLDPRDLSWRLAGNALVFLLNPHANEELNYFLGKSLACTEGMVRIYQPLVRKTKEDSVRHRFYLPGVINDIGQEAVSSQITAGLVRRGKVWLDRRPSSLEDVGNLVRRKKMEKLIIKTKSEASSKEKDEIISDYEQLLQVAEEQIQSTEKERDKYKEDCESLDERCETLINDLDKEKAKLKYQISELGKKSDRLREIEAQLSAVHDFKKLPTTLEDAINLIARIHSQKLEFTGEAIESAKSAEFSDIQMAWELLWQMGTVLHGILFSEGSKDVESLFKSKTGFELAMTEGKMTKKDAKLAKMRKIVHGGSEFDITPHAKAEKNKKSLRVHFALDRKKNRIIVGHCGNHLDTYGTRRLS